MTEIQQTPRHPLEDMPNMAERITLPASRIEVVVRRADVAALSQDALRQGLGISGIDHLAVGEVAQAATASVGAGLDMVQAIQGFILRSVIAAPSLEELAAQYGGNTSLPDYGMGSDYRFLVEEANRLNPPASFEAALTPSASMPKSSRRKK